MKRDEALATLHEIVDALRDSVMMNSVSFDDSEISKTSVGYEIRIRCNLNLQAKTIVYPILVRRKLEIKESEGLITIYRPRV